MDHAWRAVGEHLEVALDWLAEEWEGGKGKYKKLSDCPMYPECKAYVDAINIMKKVYYTEGDYKKYKNPSVKEEMEWRFF